MSFISYRFSLVTLLGYLFANPAHLRQLFVFTAVPAIEQKFWNVMVFLMGIHFDEMQRLALPRLGGEEKL